MLTKSAKSTRMRPGLQCFQPRDYQVELLDKAVKKNTIVQLGTGSGKTFIAVLLLKEYGVQMFAPFDNGGKRAFFIVEKVNLVEQQAKHIEIHTSFRVGQVHGQTSSELWQSKAACDQYMKEHHVVVITAQCLLDLINHAYIRIQDCCVLIFDECHHALGDKHPYRRIMKEYKSVKSNNEQVPRVLGLTASLIKEKVAPLKLEEQLNRLESVMDSIIETASDLVTLSKYGAKPFEAIVMCRDFDYESLKMDAFDKVKSVLKDTERFITDTNLFHKDLDVDPRRCIKDALKTIRAVLEQLGPWAAWKTSEFWEKELTKWSNMQIYPDKTILFFNLGKTAVVTIKRLLEPEMRKVKHLEQLRPFVPQRVMRLFEIFEMFRPAFQKDQMMKEVKGEDLSAIVFVDQRYIAYALHTLIRSVRKWEKTYRFVNSDFVIGASGQNLADSDNQHKRQAEVLRRFQKNEINVLIATAVLEEGVDVKQCNVVVKFDRPLDMRSYVQSKGRARKKGSRYVIMSTEKEATECNSDLRDFQKIEKLLLDRSRSVNNPVEDDVLGEIDDIDELAPPLVTETGAKLTMASAISMVNRYCSKLPSDIFTRLVPQNRIIPIEGSEGTMYRAELLLPINSPIKQSIELKDAMPNKKTAQMAVALEACRQLYAKGELDENLLPKSKECPRMLEKIDEDPDEYAPGLYTKVGSAKRKQLYDKKIARALNESFVEAGKECYIYAVELEKLRDPTETRISKRRRTINPIEHEYCFGFLSTKKIPKVPPFPVYLRQGDMEARVTVAPQKVTLTEKELEQIREFHDYLFTQVLQMCKTGNLQFDVSETTPFSTLIVPLNRTKDGGYSIKMKYVVDVVLNMQDMPRVPTLEQRKKFKFEPEKYKDAVVMPWYRNVEQPAFYYVADILNDQRPSSKFPDHHFTTFNQYFIRKYKLEIFDQDQSLLDVDFTSNRLNLLVPRVLPVRPHRTASISSSSGDVTSPTASPSVSKETVVSSSSSTILTSSQRQILVPELMDIHPISGTLWSVIAALPSVFYRLNQLLLTDELRETILINAFGKDPSETQLPENYEWSPLMYASSYEEKQSLIVKKIQQLRELNKKAIQEQEEKNKKKELEEAGEDGKFAIGVWDPEDAIRIGVDITSTRHQLDASEMETVGLTPGIHDGNISDEDADELPFTMHDYTARLAPLGRAENVATGPWAPSDLIVPSGWGDLDGKSGGGVILDIQNSTASLQFLGAPIGGFNMQALVADVGRVFEGGPEVLSSVPGSSTGGRRMSKEGAANELYRKKIQKEQLAEAQEKLESVDVLDQRDMPLRKEEVVNLDEFEDPDAEAETQRWTVSTMDEEIAELSIASDQKRAADDMTVKTEVSEREECQVLAVAANEKPNRPFSFAKESPVMVGLLRERTEEAVSHLDSEVGMGVSPCLLLTALTCSNAGDGFSLERFETIGDSFLKFAVTDYLYHTHLDYHEGKLSFARSKEVSNCNLYRLGKKLRIPLLIVSNKFDAHDSWLPPCYAPTYDFKAPNTDDAEEKDKEMERLLRGQEIEEKSENKTGWDEGADNMKSTADGIETITFPKQARQINEDISPLPYNLLTQQNISDKSIADAMEALIGVHLLTLGPNPTLKVMDWMGLTVLKNEPALEANPPLLRFIDTPMNPNASVNALNNLWQQFQFSALEEKIGYRFKERAYLVQAFTHASYINNRVTGCYQRLEFLGDAVLDYMITRYLFEDVRQYSPGVLTDLRSALVNNTIFASLAVKYSFQKHFIALCPGLHHMIEKFVKLCADRKFETNFNTEMYMVTTEEEIDEGHEEDIEVPKAMGDIFESVAGAIYLDSGRNLDTTWQVIYHMMHGTIESCCANPPRSPVRELMELESTKARFSKMERILETGKVRVTVDVGNNMRFTGMGRNYRIAKATAAKRALRYLHQIEEQRRAALAKEKTEATATTA